MPRDGSLTLSDIREPTLAIACERCGRHGRYNVQRLIAAHGADTKLTVLLATLANCERGALVQRLRPMQGEIRGAVDPGRLCRLEHGDHQARRGRPARGGPRPEAGWAKAFRNPHVKG